MLTEQPINKNKYFSDLKNEYRLNEGVPDNVPTLVICQLISHQMAADYAITSHSDIQLYTGNSNNKIFTNVWL